LPISCIKQQGPPRGTSTIAAGTAQGAVIIRDDVNIPDVFLPADAYLYMFDSESDSSGDLGQNDSVAELVEVS
jgi:hypothetical protein